MNSNGNVKPCCANKLNGVTALWYAAERGHAEVVQLLKDTGGDVSFSCRYGTPLHNAKTAKVARVLINAGAKLEARDAGEQTPLFNAVSSRNSDVVRALIAAGAKVNIRDKSGKTPLHYAAYLALAPIAGRLIEAGADVNARDGSLLAGKAKRPIGLTPLDETNRYSEQKTVRALLIKHGVKTSGQLSARPKRGG